MHGTKKTMWDKLTDIDLDRIWGKRGQFLRALRETYRRPLEKAGEEIDRRMKENDQNHSKPA